MELLDQPSGASRPQVWAGGRYLFIEVLADAPDAGGTLWLTTLSGTAFDVLADGGAPVTGAAYGPEPDDVVASRFGAGPTGGIWLVDATTGRGQQLAADGSAPRWIP